MATTITVYTNKDARVDYDQPDNYGSATSVYAMASGDHESYGYFGFDLTSIPSGNIIKNMEFHCYISETPITEGNAVINLYGTFTDWNESTISGWNNPQADYGGGHITTIQVGAWHTRSLPDLIPYINVLKPNQVSIVASAQPEFSAVIYSKEYSASYAAYLTITYDAGYVPKLAVAQGSINKTMFRAYVAAAQGPINKKVVGIKAAVTQGPINKTVF